MRGIIYRMRLRGMSLIDVLVGSALVVIVFVALLGILRTSLLITSSAKTKAGATAVATSQMEYIRSLAYDSVGTVGGIPAGPVPQYASTTMNGVSYTTRVLVQYVDDAKDGSGAADTNGITTDYKRVRVTTAYQFRGEDREVAIVSNVAPPSIETTTGGGTLRISVVDAVGQPVSGASVSITNPSLSPSVSITTFSDITGVALFPGAPTSTDYRISVTKDDHSQAQTYARDATNQNPTPGYLTVSTGQTTTGTFSIDKLATLTITSFFQSAATSTRDTLDTPARITNLLNTMHQTDAVTLLQAGDGTYALSGSVQSLPISFGSLLSWGSVSFQTSLPAGTGVTIRVLDAAGNVLPDSALPGNSTGFTTSPISLSGVSTTTYPSLALKADLITAVNTTAPRLLEWTMNATIGPVPAPNIPFTLTGAKKKGTTGSGTPIYKTVIATTTNASGTRTMSLEWDVYSLSLSSNTLISASSAPPYVLSPDIATTSAIIVQ